MGLVECTTHVTTKRVFEGGGPFSLCTIPRARYVISNLFKLFFEKKTDAASEAFLDCVLGRVSGNVAGFWKKKKIGNSSVFREAISWKIKISWLSTVLLRRSKQLLHKLEISGTGTERTRGKQTYFSQGLFGNESVQKGQLDHLDFT